VRFRAPDPAENEVLSKILAALRTFDGQATGRLCRELLGPEPADRHRFEALLGGLVKAGLALVKPDTFEKDGKTINFERAFLTPPGRAAKDATGVALREAAEIAPRGPRKRGKPADRSKQSGRPSKTEEKRPAAVADPALAETLRQWRKQEAKRRGVPAFRILTNATLEAIAATRPRDGAALLRIAGIGPKIAATYGEVLLKMCR